MEQEYYYIAYRKPRGRSRQYVGDGIVTARSVKEVREIVAQRYNCNKALTKITPRTK